MPQAIILLAGLGARSYFAAVEWVLTLMVVGGILLIAETILPGMIAGFLGFGCLLGGIVLAYLVRGARVGNLVLLIATVGVIGGFGIWLRYFPTSRLGRRLISTRTIGNIDAEKPELLNKTGEALTALRPTGVATIAGRRVDVVSEGMLIEKGTPIKVIALEGIRVVVRPMSHAGSATSPNPTPAPIST